MTQREKDIKYLEEKGHAVSMSNDGKILCGFTKEKETAISGSYNEEGNRRFLKIGNTVYGPKKVLSL